MLAAKPQSLNFTQAAVIPLSGSTAWQALFEIAHLSTGQSILIHGAVRSAFFIVRPEPTQLLQIGRMNVPISEEKQCFP